MDNELILQYENPDYPVQIQFVERRKDEASLSEWVVRPFDVELVVVNNGELRISVDESRYVKVEAGQAAFIGFGVRHKITSSTTEDTAFYSVVLSPSYVLDMSEANSLAQKYFYSVRDIGISCLLLDEANLRDEIAIDRLNDIIAINTMKRNGYELLTKGYFCQLWALLLEYMSENEKAYNGKNVPSQDELRVRSAIRYMRESYQDPISLEDIADRIHVSKNECCRCFKRVVMASPIDYLIRLRIFEAAKVLYKDPLSVDTFSELAFQTGFNNTSYFNRMFKRFLEVTPTEFTRLLKNNPERAKNLFDSLQESVAIL